MFTDQDVITLTCAVAIFTAIVAVAYFYLVSQFKKSIKSNDGLKNELVSTKTEVCAARSEISQLRSDLSKSISDLAKSREENVTLKKDLEDCLGHHKGV